ncbi:MAG: cell division protein SepF [Clostridiaceae bacterium]|nr:cell division protein SepF [Clostridiaceae bacterium]
MAGIFSAFINKLRSYPRNDLEYYDEQDSYYEEYDDSYDETAEPAEQVRPNPSRRQSGKVMNMNNPQRQVNQQVIIIKPASMYDAQTVCDHIRSGRTVICNFEGVDQSAAQHVVDFLTGATYALDGFIQAVSNFIFIMAPRGVSLLSNDGAKTDETDVIRRVAGR